jgi:(2Fe-2S) ferredoxin
MVHYKHHIFVCTNKRLEGHSKGCCASKQSEKIRDYMKARCKELNLENLRVNSAGCLDQCDRGPAVVIYPEGVWYTLKTFEEAERVIQEHLILETPVQELLMKHD